TGKRELLLHAPGEGASAAVAERFDLAIDRRDQVVVLRHRGAEDGGEEIEVLRNGEVGVEREPARHVPDPGADLPEIGHNVQAEDTRGSRIGKEERRQQTEERRLTGSVRTDDAEDLPLVDS